MIQVKQLTVYKSGKQILQIGDLIISQGDKLLLLGRNGSGKTTLLKVLGQIDSDFHGEVKWDIARKQIGFVHQEPYLFRGSVQQNILLGLPAFKSSSDEIQHQIKSWSRMFGIDHLLNHKARHLSGGEKKKTAIIRALIRNPQLLLLDEPLAELDDASVKSLIDVVEDAKSLTVIVSSPCREKRFSSFSHLDVLDRSSPKELKS